MTVRWRLFLLTILMIIAALQALVLAGHVRPDAVRQGAWLGFAGAALVLLWGGAALGVARRRLLSDRRRRPDPSCEPTDSRDDATVSLLVSAGGDADSIVVLGRDRATAAPVPDTARGRRESMVEAEAIIRQIETFTRIDAAPPTAPRPASHRALRHFVTRLVGRLRH